MSEEENQESGTSEEITLAPGLAKAFESSDDGAVSYTHLTLPTIVDV